MTDLKCSFVDIPEEILTQVMTHLFTSDGNNTRFATSVLQVCKRFYTSGINLLYRDVRFSINNRQPYLRFLRFNGLPFNEHHLKTENISININLMNRSNLSTSHIADVFNGKGLAPKRIYIGLNGVIHELNEHEIASDMARVVYRLPTSVRDLVIMLRLIMDQSCGTHRRNTPSWKLEYNTAQLRSLRLHLPSCCLGYYGPLSWPHACPDLRKIVLTFDWTHNRIGNNDAKTFAKKTYEELLDARSRNRLPRLKKGLVLHAFVNKGPNPDPLALFHHKVTVYDAFHGEIADMPLLLVGWTPDGNDRNTSYTPHNFWRDGSWEDTTVGLVSQCFWTQFFVSRERKERHPTEFMHYHSATSPTDGYVVSVATSIDHVLSIMASPSWVADRSNFRHRPYKIESSGSPGRVSFDQEYYSHLFKNKMVRAKIPSILEFVENHIYGKVDPVPPRVVETRKIE